MKVLYFKILFLAAFTSFLFVNCESDDTEEVIVVVEEEEEDPIDPFSLEREDGGADAVNILTEDVYTSLTIELAYVEGDRPKQTSLDSLTAFINRRAYKSGGITYTETVLPSSAISSLAPIGDNDVNALEEQYRTQFRSDTDIAVWILMVNEDILDDDTVDESVLGYVDTNTRMVMSIPNMITEGEGTIESGYDGVESTTFQHEFGHWIGLVNGPSDDPVHGPGEHEGIDDEGEGTGHCKVATCLMYVSGNNPFQEGYISRLQNGFLVELDALCIADLQALGGK